jgi:Uma2 family endonuclease
MQTRRKLMTLPPPDIYQDRYPVLDEDIDQEDLPPPDDPFRYGFRYVERTRNGITDWEQVPLTLEDVLHPQMEDYVNQTDSHYRLCHYLYTVLRATFQHRPDVMVMHDLIVNWNVKGMKGHVPDVAVFADVGERPQRTAFDMATFGGRPLFIIEVTSPSTRHLDVDSKRRGGKTKFRHYARVGVPLYLIVDEARCVPGAALPIYGYTLTEDSTYAPMLPDAQGRLWVEPAGLWLGTVGDTVAWFDEDGRQIGDYEDIEAARREAEARTEAIEAARREAEARTEAIEAARREAEARADSAEERMSELERRLQEAEDARRQMEEEIKRLRAAGDDT